MAMFNLGPMELIVLAFIGLFCFVVPVAVVVLLVVFLNKKSSDGKKVNEFEEQP